MEGRVQDGKDLGAGLGFERQHNWGWLVRVRLGLRHRAGFQACLAPFSSSPQSHKEGSPLLGTLLPSPRLSPAGRWN